MEVTGWDSLHRAWRRLGLPPHPTRVDIKNAYYNLAIATHPDRRPGDPQAKETFQLIQAAYEIAMQHCNKREHVGTSINNNNNNNNNVQKREFDWRAEVARVWATHYAKCGKSETHRRGATRRGNSSRGGCRQSTHNNNNNNRGGDKSSHYNNNYDSNGKKGRGVKHKSTTKTKTTTRSKSAPAAAAFAATPAEMSSSSKATATSELEEKRPKRFIEAHRRRSNKKKENSICRMIISEAAQRGSIMHQEMNSLREILLFFTEGRIRTAIEKLEVFTRDVIINECIKEG